MLPEQQIDAVYRFSFSLNTLDDMKKYVHMLETIPFSGIVQGDSFQCTAEDILFIFSQCYLRKLVLIVSGDQKSKAGRIKEYLEKEGLLFSGECLEKGKKAAA